MKKFLIMMLTLFLCFGLAACGGSEDKDSTQNEAPNESIEVDEKLLSVDITIPASFFEGEDMSTFDVSGYAKENDFTGAVMNDDGSITVTMTKSKHKEIVAEMQAEAEKNFQELVDSADLPYIESIEHDKDFKTVTVEVDRAGYDAAMFDMTPFMVGFQSMFYQVFTGGDLHSEVILKYKDTGETISSTIYPDALEDSSSEE